MSKFAAKVLLVFMIFVSAYIWWLVSWSFFEQLRPNDMVYASRNCSSLSGVEDEELRDCCRSRNEAYWLGGSYELKIRADKDFTSCVKETSASLTPRAKFIFASRTIVGLPYFHTPWRWGAGWTYGRGFRE